jgi:hypothetical protein
VVTGRESVQTPAAGDVLYDNPSSKTG